MCGRLNVIDAPIVAFLAEFLGEVPFVESRGNVAPTEPVLALRAETSGYNAALMRWWLVPHWSTGPQHKFSMFTRAPRPWPAVLPIAIPLRPGAASCRPVAISNGVSRTGNPSPCILKQKMARPCCLPAYGMNGAGPMACSPVAPLSQRARLRQSRPIIIGCP